MAVTPEFSRTERLDSVGPVSRTVAIEATREECAALARRFALLSVDRLVASLAIHRDSAGIVAQGRVEGQVTQACAITGDPVTARIDEPVALRFVAPGDTSDEVELAADSLDTVEIEGGAIDLGEAAAETMALAIDPYPRSPGADAALREAGVVGEEQAGPFGALAGLKAALGKG